MLADPLSDASQFVAPTVSAYQVFRVVLDRRGEDNALMSCGRETPLSSTLALEATRLAHEGGLAMADGIILATARLMGATLWSQDADFESMAHVRYFPAKPA